MKNSAFKAGDLVSFFLSEKLIKDEDIMSFLLSKKLIHKGEIISETHMDGDTVIVGRVSDDKKTFLESPITAPEDFSYRFIKAVCLGNPKIKTRKDLLSEPIEKLRKLKGFKDSCEKELADFRKKHKV